MLEGWGIGDEIWHIGISVSFRFRVGYSSKNVLGVEVFGGITEERLSEQKKMRRKVEMPRADVESLGICPSSRELHTLFFYVELFQSTMSIQIMECHSVHVYTKRRSGLCGQSG